MRHMLERACGFEVAFCMALSCLVVFPHASVADQYETEKAAYDKCFPQGIGDIEPPSASDGEVRSGSMRFLFLADIERCACGSNLVEVRHVVKNIHERNALSYVWEGTIWSHNDLQPGEDHGPPSRLQKFNEIQAEVVIRYGTDLHLPSGARRKALIWIDRGEHDGNTPEFTEGIECGPLISADAPSRQAGLQESDANFVDSLHTKFRSPAGDVEEILIEIKSTHETTINYNISKLPPGITVGIGGLSSYWDKMDVISIDADAVVEPKWMYDVLDQSDLYRVPEAFAKEHFLFIPSEATNVQISLQSEEVKRELVLVAVLTDEFKPIATGGLEILVPVE